MSMKYTVGGTSDDVSKAIVTRRQCIYCLRMMVRERAANGDDPQVCAVCRPQPDQDFKGQKAGIPLAPEPTVLRDPREWVDKFIGHVVIEMITGAINGYPIIHRERVPRTRNGAQGHIIIVDRGGRFQRYVASLWFEGEESWCQGHYVSTIERAHEELRGLVRLYSS